MSYSVGLVTAVYEPACEISLRDGIPLASRAFALDCGRRAASYLPPGSVGVPGPPTAFPEPGGAG